MPDIDYDKILSSDQAPINLVGLDPNLIAQFAGQEANQQARKEAILRAMISRPTPPTMVDMEVNGKMYKIPAQHVGSIINAQSLIKERSSLQSARESATQIAQAEEKRKAEKYATQPMIVFQGEKFTPEQFQSFGIGTKALSEVGKKGKPTPADEIREKQYQLDVKEFGSKEAERKRRVIDQQLQRHRVIMQGKDAKNNSLDFDTRKAVAEEINRSPEGSIFYFPSKEKGFLGGEKEKFNEIRIPQGATIKDKPITKELILEQYQYHGRKAGLSLEEFINQIILPKIK